MSNAESIFGELVDSVLASNSRIYRIRGHQIKQVCDTIIFFLKALDGCISDMLTNRFHLTEYIDKNMRKYQNKCMEFERYHKLSITTKIHIIEDHSCKQQNIFNGILDLEESFGGQNNQYE